MKRLSSWRCCLLAALYAAVAGCASPLHEPVQATAQAVVAPAAAPASAPAKPEAQAEPPVSPAVQRAFDDALRALRAGRIEEAERGLLALTRSAPELGGPYANLGLIYGRAGKVAEAVAALEQAVRASPRQPLYFNALGIAYRQHGQFGKAREAYEKAIELDAGYAAPHLNLGILHDLYLGDGKRALELYDRYLALSAGNDAVVTKWVADLKNRNGKQLGMLNPKEKP